MDALQVAKTPAMIVRWHAMGDALRSARMTVQVPVAMHVLVAVEAVQMTVLDVPETVTDIVLDATINAQHPVKHHVLVVPDVVLAEQPVDQSAQHPV